MPKTWRTSHTHSNTYTDFEFNIAVAVKGGGDDQQHTFVFITLFTTTISLASAWQWPPYTILGAYSQTYINNSFYRLNITPHNNTSPQNLSQNCPEHMLSAHMLRATCTSKRHSNPCAHHSNSRPDTSPGGHYVRRYTITFVSCVRVSHDIGKVTISDRPRGLGVFTLNRPT